MSIKSKSSAHTPAPWESVRRTNMVTGKDMFVIKANDDDFSSDIIATTPYIDKKDWHEANARLIACSPELLSSCIALIDIVEEYEKEHGISMLHASQLHSAKVVTLNAQGIKEEGYNA